MFVLWVAFGISSAAWAGMEPEAKGIGLYGDLWRPEPVHEYWDPGAYHRPRMP